MFHRFRSKSAPILGVDISQSSIKVLALSELGPRYRVEGYGHVVLPEHVFDGHRIQDESAVISALRYVLRTTFLGFGKLAVIAIPDVAVMVKTLQVSARLRDREIEDMLFIEAEKHIACATEDIYLDFQVLGASADSSVMLDVFMVASRADYVKQRVEIMRQVGLKTKCVDLESYAVGRALPHFTVQNGVVAGLDVRSDSIRVLIFDGMQLVFSREELFCEVLGYEADALDSQLFHDKVVKSVKRVLQFFFSSTQYQQLDHIVVMGESVGQADFATVLQDTLTIPTHIANPFLEMELAHHIDPDALMQNAPLYALACGLALKQDV